MTLSPVHLLVLLVGIVIPAMAVLGAMYYSRVTMKRAEAREQAAKASQCRN